jgi:hypothetical protein
MRGVSGTEKDFLWERILLIAARGQLAQAQLESIGTWLLASLTDQYTNRRRQHALSAGGLWDPMGLAQYTVLIQASKEEPQEGLIQEAEAMQNDEWRISSMRSRAIQHRWRMNRACHEGFSPRGEETFIDSTRRSKAQYRDA